VDGQHHDPGRFTPRKDPVSPAGCIPLEVLNKNIGFLSACFIILLYYIIIIIINKITITVHDLLIQNVSTCINRRHVTVKCNEVSVIYCTYMIPFAMWCVSCKYNFFPQARQPQWPLGLLMVEASRSHSDTPNSAGRLWTSDHSVAETST
jgi:hypothetical protein